MPKVVKTAISRWILMEIFRAESSVVDGFFEHGFEVDFEVKKVIRKRKMVVRVEM